MYSSGVISKEFGLMAGAGARCCMDKNDLIVFTSESYELSARVFPLDPSLQAAIHLAY